MRKDVAEKFEVHYLMESIAFGLTDGIICFLGIIVGVARATLDPNVVIIAGIVGGVADALGNSVGFFVSQSTERAVQIYGVEQGTESRVHSRKEVQMSGIFSFIATMITLFLLIFPFKIFTDIMYATILSFIIGIILAFILGSYVGKLTKENQYKSGFKYALITIAGALISYFIGEALHIII